MPRHPKEPNATCVDCGKPFRHQPSTPLRRCKDCRKGMQGVKAGAQKKPKQTEPQIIESYPIAEDVLPDAV